MADWNLSYDKFTAWADDKDWIKITRTDYNDVDGAKGREWWVTPRGQIIKVIVCGDKVTQIVNQRQ